VEVDAVDAHRLDFSRPRDLVAHADRVDDDKNAGLLGCGDRAFHRVIRGAGADGHDVPALLQCQVDVLAAAIHRLVVGEDRELGERAGDRADGVGAAADDERGPRLEPVDAGLGADLRQA
jgi:hypothetical protein